MKGPTTAGGTRQSFLDGVQAGELRFTSPINFRNKTGRKRYRYHFYCLSISCATKTGYLKAESMMERDSTC